MRLRIRLDPFARFLVAVVVCVAVALAAFELVVERLLTRNLIQGEAYVTAEAVRLVANIHLDPDKFAAAVRDKDPQPFLGVAEHLVSIPEIIRFKVYDALGTIVWSDEPRAIGLNFRDNHELAEALEGNVEVEMGLLKSEHVYEAESYAEQQLLEIYVPLRDEDGTVYSVVEVYKHPVGFFQRIERVRHTMWAIATGVGVALLVSLGGFFHRARRTERTLQDHNRELDMQLLHAEKLGVVGEMAAGIAHEINNPLSILIRKTDQLVSVADERSCPQKCREDFGILARELRRIGEVLRGLLLFARRSDATLAPTDINEILNETAGFVGPSFARANVNIASEVSAPVPLVSADANQLRQVFLNLLQNAKDAMPEGGTIRLRTYAQDGRVSAEVIDSGTGIAPDIIEQIFDPFFSTKQEGKGSGLGLSISYGVVKSHGGKIEVSSQIGGGSIFRVVLPALG